MKAFRLKVLTAAVLLSSVTNLNVSLSYANSVPTITDLSSVNGGVRLQWSVPIADSDLLTSTGFEDSEEIPNFNWADNMGNQSITDNPNGSGKVVGFTDTITNNTGNFHNYPEVNSVNSRMYFKGKSLPSNTVVSVQFDGLSQGSKNNTVQFYAGTEWFDRGFNLIDKQGVQLKYAEVVDWNNSPATFKVQGHVDIEDGKVFPIIASRATDYSSGLLQYQWSQTNQVFTRIPGADRPWITTWPNGQTFTPTIERFEVGDNVLVYGQTSFGFPYRVVPDDSIWHTYSMNTEIGDLPYYDSMKYGMTPSVIWKTDGPLFMDNVKFGYATKVKVERNGLQVYNGYLSDFDDTGARDYSQPSAPINVIVTLVNRNPIISWLPSYDQGNKYSYQITGFPRSGGEAVSDIKEITMLSGVKGYSVVINNSPNTIPDSTIDTILPFYAPNLQINSNFYVHIAAVDNAGNISDVRHIRYEDNTPPTISVKADKDNWISSDVTLTISAVDNETGISSLNSEIVDGVSYSTKKVIGSNGTYNFEAVDGSGNKSNFSYKVFNIDKTVPVLLKPEDKWFNNDVKLNLLADNLGISGLDGIFITSFTDEDFINLDSYPVVETEGINKFKAFAKSKAGSSSNLVEFSIKIDKSPPPEPKIFIK